MELAARMGYEWWVRSQKADVELVFLDALDQEGRPSIGVLFLQGQEAARPQAIQAVRTQG